MGIRVIQFNIRITFILIFLMIDASYLMADDTVQVVIKGLEGDLLANVEAAMSVPEGRLVKKSVSPGRI